MTKTFIAPSKYIQGPGEFNNLGSYVATFGDKALVLISNGGLRRSGPILEESFKKANVELVFDVFNGECTTGEIDRLSEVAKENDVKSIVGVGGGKIFDTAKAAAYYLDLPVVICPTIAGTDAPCSALSVVYTEDGAVESYLFLKENPDMVIMDSEVISKSPVRMTISGMGDALATYFEARASNQHGGDNFANGKPTLAAMAIAELCYDTLIENGYKAKLALENAALTEAVEAVIEANTLLSGIGFESGGVAAAHAVHNGFSELEECHKMLHGEKVSFGVITQLVLENSPVEELDEVLNFCVSVGLPVTLEEIGVTNPTEEKILRVAEVACAPTDTAVNMPFEIDVQMVKNAIFAADALGKDAHKHFG
ncbi:glycerol dehydrogenase [uncultured Methanobrevibacter sp.]|mgnify:CR=1 FL=1|uniref:glycerol dehydrogenase n=1 Tax=uncultured Methanobrevibacter sp. TaxID=253161 RepID=UPI00261E76EF